MNPYVKTARWGIRLTLLVIAAALALGGVGPVLLSRAVPSVSPLAVFATAVAHRGWFLALFWGIGPVFMLLLAVWKGRWFCRWVCPVGTLVSVTSRASLKKYGWKWRLNAVLFWIVIFSCLVGLPLLLWFDPLATFQRVGPWIQGLYYTAALVPGLLLPALLILCVIQPMVWCTHICPLGYGLELMQRLRKDKPHTTFLRTRRHLLIGLAVGIPAGLLGRWHIRKASAAGKNPILPPGANDPEHFAGTCIRCYACVSACPMRIIQPAGPSDRRLHQWFQPEVKYLPTVGGDMGYCLETCTNCSNVCPTGAIRSLTLRQKRQRKIGTAEVIRTACLAWADNEYCMVCQEHCPYGAIETAGGREGLGGGRGAGSVSRPVIRPDLCRGCGQCYQTCPAVKQGKAIRMLGVTEQSEIHDGYADWFEEK